MNGQRAGADTLLEVLATSGFSVAPDIQTQSSTERKRAAAWVGPWLAALGGGVWCGSYMWPMLDPFTLQIVLQEDWAQHTLGWLFFRNQPLAFPLGNIPSFLHPLGTTLGYMDAIPWVALLLRPISPWLPVDFQYLGLWVLACSVTLAFVAARAAALATSHWEQQALAGLLTVAAPTLLERLIHPALCAHVYIFSALALCFVEPRTPSGVRRMLTAAFVLLTISAATHPYLAVMVLALLVALPWRLRTQLGTRVALLVAAGELLCVGLVLAAFGYIDRSLDLAARGFGAYSANLNTFINSMGLSRLLPALPQAGSQYEGYSYMGAGWLALCVVATGLLALPRTRRELVTFSWAAAVWPLTAALGMAVFALASPVRWGEHELVRIPLYDHLSWLTQTFRSSGRFIWPLLYFIEFVVTFCILRALRQRRLMATGVLLAALGLQLYDVEATRAAALFGHASTRMYSAPEWALADGTFEHLVMYPAEIQSACNTTQEYRSDVVTGLAYLAYRHGWTFNSGYAARYSAATGEYCEGLKRDIEQHELDAHTLYVVRRWNVRELRAAGATCGRLDRLTLCVVSAQHPLAQFLAANRP